MQLRYLVYFQDVLLDFFSLLMYQHVVLVRKYGFLPW